MAVFDGMSWEIKWITVLGVKIRLKVVICLGKCKCHISDNILLPCDWLIGGFCGADAKKCDVREVLP